MTSVADGAFSLNTSITEVSIPEGVLSVGNEAFNDCVKLTSVELPASLSSIGDSAFYSCSRLKSIELPYGLASIGDGAFYGCASLASIAVPGTVAQRHDEQLQDDERAGDHGPEVAEVDLGGTRHPLELQVPLVALLGDEPVVDPPRSVAPLARGRQVAFQDPVDLARVGVARGVRPLPREQRDGRHALHVGVLPHRAAADAQALGDSRPGDAAPVHLAYTPLCVQGHGHLSFPSRGGVLDKAAAPGKHSSDRAPDARGPDRNLTNLLSFP